MLRLDNWIYCCIGIRRHALCFFTIGVVIWHERSHAKVSYVNTTRTPGVREAKTTVAAASYDWEYLKDRRNDLKCL